MARTVVEIKNQCTVEEATERVTAILEQKGYHLMQYGAERAYRNGNGYIKPEYTDGQVTLYGWLQLGIGNVGLSEAELRGFVGMFPKRAVRKVMEAIVASF